MSPAWRLIPDAKSLIGRIASVVVLVVVVSAAAAQPTPVLQYCFDPAFSSFGPGGIGDCSGHGYGGTALAPAYTTFVRGPFPGTYGIHFDAGFGTGIDTGVTTRILGIQNGPFTMMAWVGRDTASGDNMVFGTAGDPALQLGFRGSDAYMGFAAQNDSAGGTIRLHEWHHVAWRYDPATHNQDILIDGAVANSSSNHDGYSDDQELLIGTALPPNGDFAGALAAVNIFDMALRDDQIAAIAEGRPIPW